MKDVRWSWLAGFFQAEGCVSLKGELTVSQKDHEPLDLIHDFLKYHFPKYRALVRRKKFTDYHTLHLYPRVTEQLLPWLRGEKLYRAAEKLVAQNRALPKCLPIDDDWTIGFWEGDGSVFLAGPSTGIQVTFSQKDPEVLEELRDHLTKHSFGSGSLTETEPKLPTKPGLHSHMNRLTYHCGVRDTRLLAWLHDRVRSEFRREQLRAFIKAVDLYNTRAPKAAKNPSTSTPEDFLPRKPWRRRKWLQLQTARNQV